MKQSSLPIDYFHEIALFYIVATETISNCSLLFVFYTDYWRDCTVFIQLWERESTDKYWETEILPLLFYVYLSWLERYRKRRCTCFVAPSIMARCLLFTERPGIRPDAISSDARCRASDRSKQIRIYRGGASRKADLGWNVSHLPRRGAPCLKGSKSRHVPLFFFSLARRHLLLHLPQYYDRSLSRITRLSTSKTSESRSNRSAALFIQRVW